MSIDRAALRAALIHELGKAANQSEQQPAWSKRQMPAISASLAKANSRKKNI